MVAKTYNRLELSDGLPYDMRFENGKSLYHDSSGIPANSFDTSTFQQYKTFNSTFTWVSGSLGCSYQLSEKHSTNLNVSRGFSAPNIAEIGSNGVHEGTIRYETGNPDLKPGNSLQFDYSSEYNSKLISSSLDLFANRNDNFIFSYKLLSFSGED
jgi:iron complex outermembrane recepter protein